MSQNDINDVPRFENNVEEIYSFFNLLYNQQHLNCREIKFSEKEGI